MWAIFRKEMRVYFTSLFGYIVITMFLVIAVLIFRGGFLDNPEAVSNFTPFFNFMNSVYLIVIPILTLRIVTEDKKLGTIELLLTSPVSSWSIVFGKFLSAFAFVLISASLLLLFPVFLSFFSHVEWGTVVSSYLGMILTLAFFVAVGIFASSLSDNYVISGILAFGFFLLLFIISLFGQSQSQVVSKIFNELSYSSHYGQFATGVVGLKDILYFLIGTLIFLYGAKDRIESYSWK